MKPWNEYEHTVHKFDSKTYIDSRSKEIDEMLLTTEDRKYLLAKMYEHARSEAEKAEKLTVKSAEEKVEGFFEDCRVELGYTKFLTDQGRMILEDAAMENASTFEGVFNYLKGCVNASGV